MLLPLLAIIPYEIIYRRLFYVSGSQAWIYVRPAELITLPLLSLSLWDPLEITIQYHFPASAAQRPVSGALVMENYQLAQMKWPLEKTSQNISPSLSLLLALCLSISHCLPLNLIHSVSLSLPLALSLSVGSTPLKQSMKSMSRIHSFAPSAFGPACFAMVGC